MQDSGFTAQALDFSWRSTPHCSSFALPVARLPRASVLRFPFSVLPVARLPRASVLRFPFSVFPSPAPRPHLIKALSSC